MCNNIAGISLALSLLLIATTVLASPLSTGRYVAPNGVEYDFTKVLQTQWKVTLTSPRNAVLEASFARQVDCKGSTKDTPHPTQIAGCIKVPGLEPTVTASRNQPPVFSFLAPNDPAQGWQVTFTGGKLCEVTKKPRTTTVQMECGPSGHAVADKGWEGKGKDVCNYFLHIKSSYGCPTQSSLENIDTVSFTGLSGCGSSVASPSVVCPAEGGTLHLHGTGFKTASKVTQLRVGDKACESVSRISNVELTCLLPPGLGSGHMVSMRVEDASGVSQVLTLPKAVAYKPTGSLKKRFQNFQNLGVGGLDKQISEIYRRVFQSRGLSAQVLSDLGMRHTKGVLLYGPPGTGKTLIARTVAKLLGTDKVTLISTPDIMQKYLGESEKMLRSYFEPAEKEWQQKGDESDIYIIIFDEIDAIFRERSGTDNQVASKVYDSVVNALLSKLDGLEEVNNYVVFGLTNRRELIDPALLRPGRFEVQLEIGLPDAVGRREIFDIHTKKLREGQMCASDVDFTDLVNQTPQLSGAEIAGIVRNAVSLAMSRYDFDKDPTGSHMKISKADFAKAIKELNPAYGFSVHALKTLYMPNGILECGDHDNILWQLDQLARKVTSAPALSPQRQGVLLYGDPGTGKTALAVRAVVEHDSDFEFVAVLTPLDFVELHEAARIKKLVEVFDRARNAESAAIVIDDIDAICEVLTVGNQVTFSRSLLSTIGALLTSSLPETAKLFVVATTSLSPQNNLGAHVLKLQSHFPVQLEVPRLNNVETASIFQQLNLLRSESGSFEFPDAMEIGVRDAIAAAELSAMLASKGKKQKAFPSPEVITLSQDTVDMAMQILQLYPNQQPVQEEVFDGKLPLMFSDGTEGRDEF